jgi:ribonuclease HII
MQIDFANLSDQEKYKLLVGCVVPRPIALMSTISHDGVVNAAPYSFFNAICDVPPAVAVGVNCLAPGVMKDTAQNIRDTGEFVVNLVSEEIAQAMNLTAVSFPPEIDEFNILQATLRAMSRAVHALRLKPALVLVDGNRLPVLSVPAQAVVKGDALVPAISAASIVAKVRRDAWCQEAHEQFPQYGFAGHKGYPTAEHLAALRRHGPSPVHRRSFGPVRECQAPA